MFARDPVSTIKHQAAGIGPGGTITTGTDGDAFNVESFESFVVGVHGTPGAGETLDVAIQDSADGSTGWADVKDDDGVDLDSTASGSKIQQIVEATAGLHLFRVRRGRSKPFVRVVLTPSAALEAYAWYEGHMPKYDDAADGTTLQPSGAYNALV